jgi:hypothetical protein
MRFAARAALMQVDALPLLIYIISADTDGHDSLYPMIREAPQ